MVNTNTAAVVNRLSFMATSSLTLCPSAAWSGSRCDVNRKAPSHSLRVTGAHVFLPANNRSPQATGINSQRVAYVFEGERSGSLVLENPELSLSEFPPPMGMARCEI